MDGQKLFSWNLVYCSLISCRSGFHPSHSGLLTTLNSKVSSAWEITFSFWFDYLGVHIINETLSSDILSTKWFLNCLFKGSLGVEHHWKQSLILNAHSEWWNNTILVLNFTWDVERVKSPPVASKLSCPENGFWTACPVSARVVLVWNSGNSVWYKYNTHFK